jgi:hypothetical protein
MPGARRASSNEADPIPWARGGLMLRGKATCCCSAAIGTRDDNQSLRETAMDDYPHFAVVLHNTSS